MSEKKDVDIAEQVTVPAMAVLNLSQGAKRVLGIVSAIMAIALLADGEHGKVTLFTALFCAFIAGANLLPAYISKFFADAVAISCILLSVWMISLLLTNKAEGSDPGMPLLVGGISLVYLYRRYKNFYAGDQSIKSYWRYKDFYESHESNKSDATEIENRRDDA